jgi:hypothetical protein
MSQPEPELLTLAEAQIILGFKKTKMYEVINSGEIETVDVSKGDPKAEPHRVGDRGRRPTRRIRREELNRYIEARVDGDRTAARHYAAAQ